MVLIYASDMVWCQKGVLRVLFEGFDFFPKMRMKINLFTKTNMGSTSTPRPNQRHQQVAWAYSTRPVSVFWPNEPYNGYSAGYAITRTGYAMPELVPERAIALAQPVP